MTLMHTPSNVLLERQLPGTVILFIVPSDGTPPLLAFDDGSSHDTGSEAQQIKGYPVPDWFQSYVPDSRLSTVFTPKMLASDHWVWEPSVDVKTTPCLLSDNGDMLTDC